LNASSTQPFGLGVFPSLILLDSPAISSLRTTLVVQFLLPPTYGVLIN
jgi:hypothetical protein